MMTLMQSSVGRLLTMLAFLLGGGHGDLLDYVSTQGYWKAKSVQVDPEAMLKVLNPSAAAPDFKRQIENLGSEFPKVRALAGAEIAAAGPAALGQLQAAAQSPNAEVARGARELIEKINAAAMAGQVRRLMAIRTLGEMRHRSALPALEKLAAAGNAFTASYARRAVAAIQGGAVKNAGAAETLTASLEGDTALLPEGVGLVVQYRLDALEHTPPDELAKLGMPIAGGGLDPQAVHKAMEMKLIAAAEHLGNARLDAVTFALAKDVNNQNGFAVFVFHGRFDRGLFKVLNLAAMGFAQSRVGEADVYRWGGRPLAIIVPSEEVVILFAGDPSNGPRIDALVAAVTEGKGKAGCDKELAALLAAADKSGPIWGVAAISDTYRNEFMPGLLNGVESATLSSAVQDGRVELKLSAPCADAAAAKAASDALDAHFKTMVAQGEGVVPQIPALAPLLEFVRTFTPAADGAGATVAAQTSNLQPGRLFLPLLMQSGIMSGLMMEMNEDGVMPQVGGDGSIPPPPQVEEEDATGEVTTP